MGQLLSDVGAVAIRILFFSTVLTIAISLGYTIGRWDECDSSWSTIDEYPAVIEKCRKKFIGENSR